ncbi:MAG: DEAD/DEAH box helicase [Bacteroidota bacterium]
MNQTIQFSDLFLSEQIMKGITAMGYETPTPIQEQSIPVMLAGEDMIGQAQTGTGKTAAFGLPVLEKTDTFDKNVQTLILCPTRELCVQIADEIEKMGASIRGIKVLSIYGGDSMSRQMRGLKEGAQIVAGTPGRIMDHLRRGSLKLQNLKIAILDEADEMLNMGFREDIETILQDTPAGKQTAMFSATMSKQIQDISRKFLNNPRIIKVSDQNVTAKTIEQVYFETRGEKKTRLINNLIQMHELKLSLVFCNTKARVDGISEELRKAGQMAESLHGDLSQAQRNQVLNRFKKAEINVLVATDVAARGLDVNNVDAVFNFDLPHDNEYYVHRIGRTGRAGKVGKAFSFAESRKDDRKIMEVERFIKMRIEKAKVPDAAEILNANLLKLENRLINIATENNLKDYEKVLSEMYARGFDPHTLAACLLKSKLDDQGISLKIEKTRVEPRRKDRYNDDNGSNRNYRENNPRNGKGKRKYEGDGNSPKIKLQIGLGKKDKIRPGDIVGAITGECNISGNDIGVIDMFDHFSYFEIAENQVKKVLKGMNKNKIKGKKAMLSVARN